MKTTRTNLLSSLLVLSVVLPSAASGFIPGELWDVWAEERFVSTLSNFREECSRRKIDSQAMIIASPTLGARSWPTLAKSKLYDASFEHRFRGASPVTPEKES